MARSDPEVTAQESWGGDNPAPASPSFRQKNEAMEMLQAVSDPFTSSARLSGEKELGNYRTSSPGDELSHGQ